MGIELNITTAPQPKRSKAVVPEKLQVKAQKQKRSANASSGFSFEFGGGTQKVKAVVARKRPIAKSQPADAQSVNTSKVKQSVALKKRKATPATDASEDKLDKLIANETSAMNSSIMLNVCVKPSGQPPKPQLTKEQKLKLRQDKRKGKVLGKVLTQQEFKEGIRKFSENPNKKPRAADIFHEKDMQERKAQNEAVESEIMHSDGEHNEERPAVNLNARKSNAFRVKRAEDSSVSKINLFSKNPEAKIMGQRAVKPIKEKIFDGTKVDTLGLHPHAVKNLADLLGITELTTVQRKTIPKALEGKDILVRSQTGSGKTLAYALPLVEKLQALRPKMTREAGTAALVIVPTRELAIQTYELFIKLVKPFTWLVPGVLMGGEKRKAEKARLRKGINILVGTPGRLVDHLLHTETFNLGHARFLVLDEADRLLEMGYERDVKEIVDAFTKHRGEIFRKNEPVVDLQRMLLSATLTSAVQQLAGLTLNEPIFIDNSEEGGGIVENGVGYNKQAIETASLADGENGVLSIPENLTLSFVVVPPKLRLVTLAGLLAKEYAGMPKFKAIIFMSTMEMVNFHHDMLNEQLTKKILDEEDEEMEEENSADENEGEQPLLKGLRFFRLHGSMSQTERQGVFKGYRDCKTGVLLATDVFGRGIDVPEVNLVVQYSPPQGTSDFVHRVGRTARAGKSGRAVLFLSPNEAQFVRLLEDKRIRMSQIDMDVYLSALNAADNEAHTVQEAASNLQHKFQELLEDDKELYDKACKAFVSWMKFYSTFPRELKPIFNIKNIHMGHYAKSFALKDAPSSFAAKHSAPKAPVPTNRLTYTERDPKQEKLNKEKSSQKRFSTTVTNEVRNTNNPNKLRMPSNNLLKKLHTSRALTTSEFDSGLPETKKKKY